MIIVYALIALFIAWIWIDYFRLIEVYGREDLKYILLTFFLGAGSTQIVLALHNYNLLDWIPLELNGAMWNDFLYCIFKIGLIEEIAKMIPFLLMFLVFRRVFKEPIDYVAFAAISALGFAAAENILYFIGHDGEVISARAILTSVAHMFYSALIGYGIVLAKYRYVNSRFKLLVIPGFALLAIFSHAFYDFWLITAQGTERGLISILFFLLTVSWYSTILNNALNNDSTFSYKRSINPTKVMNRILLYYVVVFAIQFGVNTYIKNITAAEDYLVNTFTSSIYVILVVSARLSRFTLIQGRWQPIRLELPFRYGNGGVLGVRVKGDSFLETALDKYYEEYFTINPVSKNARVGAPQLAYIEKKLFLKNDESFSVARVFKDETKQEYELYLLKPKTDGMVLIDKKYPIASFFKYKDIDGKDLSTLTVADFSFIEWVYIKPLA